MVTVPVMAARGKRYAELLLFHQAPTMAPVSADRRGMQYAPASQCNIHILGQPSLHSQFIYYDYVFTIFFIYSHRDDREFFKMNNNKSFFLFLI